MKMTKCFSMTPALSRAIDDYAAIIGYPQSAVVCFALRKILKKEPALKKLLDLDVEQRGYDRRIDEATPIQPQQIKRENQC